MAVSSNGVHALPTTLEEMFGARIARGIGDTVGLSVGDVYKRAVALGCAMKKREFDLQLCFRSTATGNCGRSLTPMGTTTSLGTQGRKRMRALPCMSKTAQMRLPQLCAR